MNKKAFVLSIVLWIVSALLFGIATLAIYSKDTFLITNKVHDKLKTKLISEGILEYLKFYILTADYDNTSFRNTNLNNGIYKFPNSLIADGRWYKLNDNIEIKLKDTSSMINVFRPPTKILASLFTNNRQKKFIIEDSLNDWIDLDDEVSLNGAENSRYSLQQNLKFKVRNSPAIQNIEELRLINGIESLNSKDWNYLKTQLFYGRNTLVNLALLDSDLLSNILKIDKSKADELIYFKKENITKFVYAISKLKSYDNNDMAFRLSKQIKIDIKVSINSTTSLMQTIIDFKPQNRKKVYVIVSYKVI